MTTRAAEAKCMKHWNRLSARLDLGLTCKLTLVTAPEGFGKSSLLAHWANGVPAIVALIDLDHNTDAPDLIKSMARTLHELLPAHVPALPATETPCEELLVDLINSIASVPHDLAIILDDYCSDPRLDECLGFLIEYLPPQTHLYIAGEAMPSVSSLPRLRVRRQLVELTETDLGLTVPEVGSILSRCLDCQVETEELARLVALTHGSISDLRALIEKLRGSDDPASRLKTFVTSSTGIST